MIVFKNLGLRNRLLANSTAEAWHRGIFPIGCVRFLRLVDGRPIRFGQAQESPERWDAAGAFLSDQCFNCKLYVFISSISTYPCQQNSLPSSSVVAGTDKTGQDSVVSSVLVRTDRRFASVDAFDCFARLPRDWPLPAGSPPSDCRCCSP